MMSAWLSENHGQPPLWICCCEIAEHRHHLQDELVVAAVPLERQFEVPALFDWE